MFYNGSRRFLKVCSGSVLEQVYSRTVLEQTIRTFLNIYFRIVLDLFTGALFGLLSLLSVFLPNICQVSVKNPGAQNFQHSKNCLLIFKKGDNK